jgi:hypothetical protein
VPTVVIPPLAITLITSTPRCSRLRDASRDQVGVPLLDVVVQCLPHLLLEVELVAWDRLRSLPDLARPKQNDPSPAPMQLGEAPRGGFVFVDELVETAGHGAPG